MYQAKFVSSASIDSFQTNLCLCKFSTGILGDIDFAVISPRVI